MPTDESRKRMCMGGAMTEYGEKVELGYRRGCWTESTEKERELWRVRAKHEEEEEGVQSMGCSRGCQHSD